MARLMPRRRQYLESAEAPPTPREKDVLRLLASGMSNREIRRRSPVTDQTVKSHVSHILDKLGVCSRTQAALYAIEKGLWLTAGERKWRPRSYPEAGVRMLSVDATTLLIIGIPFALAAGFLLVDDDRSRADSRTPGPHTTHLIMAGLLLVVSSAVMTLTNTPGPPGRKPARSLPGRKPAIVRCSTTFPSQRPCGAARACS